MDTKARPQPALRVALYGRRSSDLQNEASTEQQRFDCLKLVKEHGWDVVADYADEERSGHDNQRPQLLAMLEAAKRKAFDVLVVWNLSRLARDSGDQGTWIKRLEFNGLRVVAYKGGYDTIRNAKERKINRTFTGLMDELQSDDTSELIHRGLAHQARQARWCGGRPYAYRLRPILSPTAKDVYGQPERMGSELERDPEQAKIVVEIFERYASGESAVRIAAALNARGIPSAGSTWKRVKRRNHGWMASSVRAILVNPLFKGCMRWNASRFVRDPDTRKHVRRKRPESEWITNQVEALRVVSDALWERVQARIKSASNDDPRLKLGGKASLFAMREGTGVHRTF
jgi:site-specific DNA recombinase